VSSKRYFAFLLVFVILHGKLQAQDSLSVDLLVPDVAIKVSPLHLINFYPTVELSYEQKIAGRFTAQVEFGYVLDYGTEWYTDFLNKRGIKAKLEGRNYFWGRTDRRKLYYAAVEAYINVINFDRQDSRQECFDLECSYLYRREYLYKMEYREQGLSLKLGMFRYMFSSSFFIDINSGFTLRIVGYNEPDDLIGQFGDDVISPFEIPDESDRITVGPNLGVRFGYRLR
jgi:hypothetical protein